MGGTDRCRRVATAAVRSLNATPHLSNISSVTVGVRRAGNAVSSPGFVLPGARFYLFNSLPACLSLGDALQSVTNKPASSLSQLGGPLQTALSPKGPKGPGPEATKEGVRS
jgi:hypothetical protein